MGSPDASPPLQGEGRPEERAGPLGQSRDGRAFHISASSRLPSAQNNIYTKAAYFGVACSVSLQRLFLPHHHQESCGRRGCWATQLVVTPS